MQESALKEKEEEAEKRSEEVFKDFDYLGLKIARKVDLCGGLL